MTATEPEFLSRGNDYLGFIDATLRDLVGYGTLANELVQNADDAAGAESMVFDLRDEALVVQNDGVFADCERPDLAECPWRVDRRLRCDFHRFRWVAGGDKRNEQGAIGAFGIGFVAVYQVTDAPEVISARRHWIIQDDQEEAKRIRICPGCALDGNSGTTFVLPWARDEASPLRQRLHSAAVTAADVDGIEADLAGAIPNAMVFLKKLQSIELRRNGEVHLRVEREAHPDRTIVRDSEGNVQDWLIIEGEFEADAAQLRSRTGVRLIEDKRTATVRIAVPHDAIASGLLFQGLPTQHATGLPFHVNADFFPSSDRKKIIFESDYQSDWNRSAIRGAARALAESLTELRDNLTPARLWELIAATAAVAGDSSADQAFHTFWDEIAKVLPGTKVAYGADGEWHLPGDVVRLQSDAERAAIDEFVAIGIVPVHEDLRAYVFTLRGREGVIPLLTATRLASALADLDMTEPIEVLAAPAPLQESDGLERLQAAADELMRPGRSGADAQGVIARCAVLLDRSGKWLLPPTEALAVDDETAGTFAEYSESLFVDLSALSHAPRLADLCEPFTAGAALSLLEDPEETDLSEAHNSGRLDVGRILRWFSQRMGELDDVLRRERLAALPIFPSGASLTTLDRLAVPGGFTDPLGLTEFVDLDILSGLRDFLVELGVRELTFPVYAAEHLPRRLTESGDALRAEDRRAVVQLIAARLGEIVDNHGIRDRLRGVPLVETVAGWVPGAESYFDSAAVRATLGDEMPWAIVPMEHSTAISDALFWLGVRDRPRSQDLLDRIEELTGETPSDASVTNVQAILGYIGRQPPDLGGWERLDALKELAWLPARSERSEWYAPKQIYSDFSASLFASQARFIDLPYLEQTQIASYLEYLGVTSEPTPAMVVRHLRHLVDQGESVKSNIYEFLERHAEDPAIDLLRGERCLVLGGRPYRADQVYWAEHSFHPYRQTLLPELRQYSSLLAKLGVKEAPDHSDAIAVLNEISADAGTRLLSEEQTALVTECWRILDRAIDAEQIGAEDLSGLGTHRVIPSPRGILEKPDWLYFEDRPGLATDLGPLLSNNVIARPPGAWRAMRAAGVQDLGQASELRLVECRSPRPDHDMRDRLTARRGSVMRVVEAQTAETEDVDRAIYDRVRCLRVDALRVQFSLRAFGGARQAETAPKDYHAVFVREEEALYFVMRSGVPPWRDIARELAYAVFPGLEPGGPASGVKDALEAETEDEAAGVLDDLGYPRLADDVTAQRSAPQAVGFDPSDESDLPPDWDSYQPPAREHEAEGSPAGGGGEVGTSGGSDAGEAGKEGTAGSGSGARSTSSGGARRPQARLRSYVAPSDDGPGISDDSQMDDDPTDPAGVARVLEAERRSGRLPTEMPHHHPGYDVESRNADGLLQRYIEIKSTADVWGDRGVALSRRQFEAAQEYGDRYWLYVVERANTDDARIYRIQDPAHQARWFFFDDGWRAVDGSVGPELMPGEEPDTA